MSVRHRSNFSERSRRRAEVTSAAVRACRFMRLRVRLTSSSKSGSSSTISTVGLDATSDLLSSVSVMNSRLPPPWVCEYQPENAASSLACLVEEGGPIGLGQLPCEKQSEPGSPATTEERLKDPFHQVGQNSGSAVRNLEEGARGRAHTAIS